MKKEKKSVKTAENTLPSAVKKTERELPFYVVKRGDAEQTFGRAALIRASAIVIALLLCGIATIFVTGDNPISIYATMFKGAFGDAHNLWKTLQDLAILLCVSLAVTPAFKMRFWNTGAEGQVLISALATAMCMFYFGGAVPTPVLMLIMVAGSVLAGVIWAVIPAIFKAFWGTNETLFTLMMNYVAIQLVEVFLKVADKSGSNTVGPSLLKHGWFPELFGQKYLLNILIVAVLTVLVYIYLKYSKHGYEISVVGESENTARYIGVNVKKVIIRTMVVSGALCGVAGLLLVAGTSHSIDSNLVGGRGFTAIMVSWLAKFNPLMMVLTTLLLVFLNRGSAEVTTKFGLNTAYSEILTGVILFFIIGCEFFIQYKIVANRSHKLFKKKGGSENV
ncbi:MAG: ABC transporter permease [Clostridia bacterium]|nr:ABC transporter permease [Clostridia bacterium]MBQ8398886.1 ABC transporter permease [Clostridia bacterium]